jgi:tetratricopeptide (TPR) repeat protein
VYRRKGEYDRAIADASEALRLDPQLAPAYFTRGEAYRRKGDFDRAIANLTEAVRLAPGDGWAEQQLEMAKRGQR